ncbi:hypothetical protein GCM10009807_01140 [Microbacterium lacus]|uniref:Uncharacterized protein n=2 Tax=Microbacterium lacus TaxID=415217 RepID=A0ABP4RVY4_9MICO
MSTPGSNRSGIAWAIAGGVVLIAGIVAIIVAALTSQSSPQEAPTQSWGGSSSTPAATSESPVAEGTMVDASVRERGWIAEPITSDAQTYMVAALQAASTFDTTKAPREDWLGYLDNWFTPDTRYTAGADQLAAMEASQVELRQGVVLPKEQWDDLAREDGRVTASVGEIALVPVTEDPSGDMSIGTADVTLTFTRSDGADGEVSYEEQVRVSVQVLCGPGSVPTSGTRQRSGDCKVVRYFTEPLEP